MQARVVACAALAGLVLGGLSACALDPETVGAVSGTGTSGTGQASSMASTSAAQDTTSSASSEGADDESADTAAPTVVNVHLRATADPWPHDDGLSGQTPYDAVTGIRSLTLLDTGGRLDPLVVFDLGTEHVAAPQDPGSDTIVATVPVTELVLGAYDRARVGVSFIQFSVMATAHLDPLEQMGSLEAVYVLADDTMFDGAVRALGWSRFTFGSFTINNPAEIPATPQGSPFELLEIDGASFLEFGVSLLVDPSIDNDVDVTLQLNVHESFRWQDIERMGSDSAFDITPTTFEPVLRVGANDYSLTFD